MKEKKKKKLKTEENQKIAEINNKIHDCQREIKIYAAKNNKQREQLQLLSQDIGKKIESINYKTINYYFFKF